MRPSPGSYNSLQNRIEPKGPPLGEQGALCLGAAGVLGALRPAWCHTRTAVPPVPSPRSEWPQAGDPAQDLAELPLTLFSSSSPLAEVPVPAGRVRGARGKGGGEWHNQQIPMMPPALLMLRQTALWAVFEHKQAQKYCLFSSL